MDLTPYVDGLRRDLLAAAEAAGPEAREAAERLSYALDPSARLALMEAISQAASEITAELPAGAVDVRLAGRELEFGVHVEQPTVPLVQPAAPEEEDEDDGAVTRVTLRIPESLKAKAEEYAARSGHSLNTWLVNVVRAATREGGINVDIDLSSISTAINDINDAFAGFDRGRGKNRAGKRMTGWL